jgi:hypothetical protein
MKIKIYKDREDRELLEQFFIDCSVENNSSMETIGINKRHNALMFLVLDGEKIVNTSYVHDFSEYYPNSYRIFTRTATLPKYRTVGVSRRRDMTSAAGLAALSASHQVDYARANGAKLILFTTNIPGNGMDSSSKVGRFLKMVEPHDPRFEFYDQKEIYGCDQMVWRLKYRDIISDPPQDPI